MKSKWINIGAPIVALVVLVAFGMIGCSSDPMSSPDNGTESYAIETATEEAPLMSTMSNTRTTTLKGRLFASPDTGDCWFLVVNDKEAYELIVNPEFNYKWENNWVTILGNMTTFKPDCSNLPVFKVEKIELVK